MIEIRTSGNVVRYRAPSVYASTQGSLISSNAFGLKEPDTNDVAKSSVRYRPTET